MKKTFAFVLAIILLFLILNGLMRGYAGQWFPWGDGGDFWPMLLRRIICQME